MKIYLVGGAIRDSLLKLPIIEQDWLVLGSTPEELLAQGFMQVGKDFPVFLHPLTKEEYALARTERKNGLGYTGFQCDFSPHITLEEDLLRRDLTINAIAQDNEGNLLDPYGGLTDLKQRCLRHISPAFREDPLRVLRVARFAAKLHRLNFVIAPETLQLMIEISTSGELNTISPERIWVETTKALSCDDPQIYFEVLKRCNALSILFPEVAALFGVPAPAKWHPEIDTGIHTLLALKQAAKLTTRLDIRFAILVHDIGKGTTPRSVWPSHPEHGKRGLTIIRHMAQRLRIPKKIVSLSLLLCEFHDAVHVIDLVTGEEIVTLLNRFNAFKQPDNLEALLLTSLADIKGRLGFEYRFYPQADYLRACFNIANEIQAPQIVKLGFSGATIKQELDRRRTLAINAFRLATPMLKEFRVQE